MSRRKRSVIAWVLSAILILVGVFALPLENESRKSETSITISPNVTNATDEMESHAETCASPLEEFVSPVHGSPRCCRQCEPGTGMLRLCTDVEDTKCRPCDVGSEFSLISSATAKCQQCRRCQDLHPLAKTRTPCTPTANTECECVADHYMSLTNQTCKPCTKCKPNEGVVKPCTWNSDTQCQACPSGFWSATTEDSVKCVPCQTCTSDEVVVKECSVSSDTVCCPKTNQNCTLSDASINGKHVSWSCTSSLLSSVACDHLSVTDRSKDPSVSRGRLEDELLLLTSNKN
ncbi:Tumor necrosis factor receptor superfamily member 16 [Fasciolopsis buskii]|uniref:Tumor necrosis factor receptor superfamily member 16 n=1 Tax=Fasciolopsis buskii TaxID=27845 RepID=A0A8E0RU35_9TREM|nr:Tumor necrosis factor receptor superfamily member 16 [Fasciolopsis buski]